MPLATVLLAPGSAAISTVTVARPCACAVASSSWSCLESLSLPLAAGAAATVTINERARTKAMIGPNSLTMLERRVCRMDIPLFLLIPAAQHCTADLTENNRESFGDNNAISVVLIPSLQ